MIEADYVKFLPISRIYEPPKSIELHYSDTRFSELVPPDLLAFFNERAHVRSLMKVKDVGWVVRSTLEPCRGINITFNGHESNKAAVYHLQEMAVAHVDEATRTVHMAVHLPETIPEREYFNAWVQQSINRTAGDMYRGLLTEFATSAECGAVYLTQSQFVFDLLQKLGTRSPGSIDYAATTLLNIDVPTLKDVDARTLMRVRMNDGEAFQSFRNALERGLMDLRTEEDGAKRAIKLDSMLRELTEIKLGEVDRQLSSLRKSALTEAGIALTAMTAAVCAPGAAGISLLALVAAAFQGFKTYEDYQRQAKQNPAFFLWKLKQ
jgi:hypothetical protein